MSTSTIYFIQAGDGGPIKIGFTRGCPLDRMANLQTGCPTDLRLVAHARGTADDEQELHKRFAHLRLRGEWFQAKPELVEFVRGIRFATREEPPLERADEPMIGDLGREDLDKLYAYVSVRTLKDRALYALNAMGPDPISAVERNEFLYVHLKLQEVLHSQNDIAFANAIQLADPEEQLSELCKRTWDEYAIPPAVREAEYAEWNNHYDEHVKTGRYCDTCPLCVARVDNRKGSTEAS